MLYQQVSTPIYSASPVLLSFPTCCTFCSTGFLDFAPCSLLIGCIHRCIRHITFTCPHNTLQPTPYLCHVLNGDPDWSGSKEQVGTSAIFNSEAPQKKLRVSCSMLVTKRNISSSKFETAFLIHSHQRNDTWTIFIPLESSSPADVQTGFFSLHPYFCLLP